MNMEILRSIPYFSMPELDTALKALSNMRCADEENIVGEMVKYASDQFKTELLRCFNESLHSGIFEETWYYTCFQMLPKSGDLTKVSNWRPIAILPILHKIFARLVYNRSSPVLFQHQSRDQHVFTPFVRIEDALLCAECSIQYALEFNVPLWLLSMDLRKAFDTVDHVEVFRVLGRHGLDPACVVLLRKLYSSQTGSVNGSRFFDILRGVRQGDVLSAIIFNCVLDSAFENWKTQLVNEGLFMAGDHERMTNTRYADDILLYAKSLMNYVGCLSYLLMS